MKKRLQFLVAATMLCSVLLLQTAAAQCTAWQNPSPTTGWPDFNSQFGGAPCNDGMGCPFNEIDDFGVTAAEAYAVNNFKAGGTYSFSICNGVGAGTWVPDFTIIAPSGAIDAWGPGIGDSCTITWTASESGTYLIVINELGFCGGGANTFTFNGYPALTCVGNTLCGECDAGEFASSLVFSLCNGAAFNAVNSPSSSLLTGGHGLFFDNSEGGTGGLGEPFVLGNVPDANSIDADLGGLLSSNGYPPMSGTWIIHSASFTDSANPFQSICNLSSSTLTISFGNSPIVAAVDNGNSSATATAFGGNAPYTYDWSTGDSTSTITNLPSGTYNVVITDANGCTGQATVDVLSGIKGIESLESISISPNPTNGSIVVNLALRTVETVQLSVLDITGRELALTTDTTAGRQFGFDLSGQPAGVYLLKLTASGGTTTRKLVVNR
jgi:Secretion system C-terminal sorting domain